MFMAKFESIKANSPAAIAASPFKKGEKINNNKTAPQFPTRRLCSLAVTNFWLRFDFIICSTRTQE